MAEAMRMGGPHLVVYCFEPEDLAHATTSGRHLAFVQQGLADMDAQWAEWEAEGRMPAGLRTAVLHAAFPDVLTHLMQRFSLTGVHSYAESGLRHTYARDIRVRDLLVRSNVPWHEHQRDGIQRGRRDRHRWREQWFAHMSQPQEHPDFTLAQPETTVAMEWPDPWREIPIPTEGPAGFQPGGERRAHAYLESFVTDRIRRYARAISKPAESREGCSRLSAYLAWGNLSIRQVHQRQARSPPAGRRWSCRAAAQL